MNETYKLEIPRFISAVLAAKPPGEQFPRRGWWFVGEKAGERFAVNRILTLQQRRAVLICLQKGVSAVTAQELGGWFGQEAKTLPLQHFLQTFKTLAGLKIARVEGEELGEPMRIFSHIRKTWGRVEWAFTSDYLRWRDQYPRQEIKYPVIGLHANLKKNPMANMLMLAAAEWYSMNKRKGNSRAVPVWQAIKYYPACLPNVIKPLKTALEKFGWNCPGLTTQDRYGDFAKLQIDISKNFPKPPKRKRGKGEKVKEPKGGKEQDIQSYLPPPQIIPTPVVLLAKLSEKQESKRRKTPLLTFINVNYAAGGGLNRAAAS